VSTALEVPPAPATSRRGSLLRAELHRFRSRRMVRVLLLLAVLGFVGGVATASTQYAKTSPARVAAAEAERQQILVESEGYRRQCLDQVGGDAAEEQCGPPLTLDNLGDLSNFLRPAPFRLAEDGRNGVVAVAVLTAALAFLLGATYVGAEWSTRSMVALLFWEPRRLRVMAAKLTILAVLSAVLAVLAAAAWLLAARALAATRGTGDGPPGLFGELVGSAGRGVLLVVLMSLLGFGVANLLRNTAAAFGFGFVYFAIVENIVRGVRPRWQPYLLTENTLALLQEGGLKIFLNESFVDSTGAYQTGGREVLVGNLHGALVLTAVTAVVVAAGVVLFARRDLD
jgi:ABC-type transport system involved in multi-copper enzyme maturation permease subunit